MDAPERDRNRNYSVTNPLETLPEVAYALHSQSPQDIGDLVAMMFPEPMQLAVSFTVTNVVWEVFKEVFSIAASQGAKFDTSALALAQIKKEINYLHRKVDKLLNNDFEAAGHRLEHAMNYMENTKKHPDAYEELKQVLNLATKAFYKLDKFRDKIFIQRIAVFSRLMTDCYDKETKRFVLLPSLSKEDKKTIADAVFINMNAAVEEFYKIEVPFMSLPGTKKKIKNENQDLLDSLLKVSFIVS